jgi:hypothetical protein
MKGEPTGHPNRRHGRVRCQDVECNFGPILDLSASGMRVKCRKPPAAGTVVEIRLMSDEYCVQISAIVRWTSRAGLFSHEAGLEFTDIHADARRMLTELARSAAGNDTIARDVRKMRDSDERKAG